jgi:predicted O-methyltransferase YrrM
MSTAIQLSTRAVKASAQVHELLDRLHSESEAQEGSVSQGIWYIQRRALHFLFGTTWSSSSDVQMVDKYVSLERDKCQLAYLLARANGAKNIVEAGTSFGVSTIYLALAVGQNVAAAGGSATGKVIATEKEPTKAARAQENWKLAGEEVEPWIEVRVGDLLETLKQDGVPEEIDMLLLDSESMLIGSGTTLMLTSRLQSGRHWRCPHSRSSSHASDEGPSSWLITRRGLRPCIRSCWTTFMIPRMASRRPRRRIRVALRCRYTCRIRCSGMTGRPMRL